ncbi:MAG: PDZ domain-containing protein [Ruminococcaceae bacterium]|nr:PDZ domain-containing protein [Oscillospiraceae bacterium]
MENNFNNQNDYNIYSSLDGYDKSFNDNTFSENKNNKKEKKRFSFLTLFLCVLIAASVGATTALGAVFLSGNLFKDQEKGNTVVVTDDGKQQIISEIKVDETVSSVIEAVAKKVTPSVVGIATTASTNNFFGGGSETTGEGSGIIYSKDGYIITNYHVIESAVNSSSSKIEVYLSSNTEKAYTASVVGYNISHDLAVIKITADNLVPIELADADSLRVGQYVAAIGSPGGLDFMGSVTYGIISGLNRVISDSSTGSAVELIQTDAAINPGNSGGALVNIEGKLIGVNSSKIAATEYEGMGFAIPVDTVKTICDNIIANKDTPNPYIGVTISDRYSADDLKQLGYPVGAVVSSVIKNGPAYEAGIRRGDIITSFNGKALKDYTELSDLVAATKPGDKVSVKIYRSGKYYTTKIKIASNNAQ